MKCFSKLLYAAGAVLWALPVSAIEWNQRAQGRLDTTGPELESLEPLSNWTASSSSGFQPFEAADYQLNFDIFNAAFVSGDNQLVIEAFDETGSRLIGSDVFPEQIEYQVSIWNVPPRLTIHPDSHTLADSFVHSLPLIAPTAVRIQVRPILEVDVLDCNQHVRMWTWFRYHSAGVATSGSDLLVIPRAFVCP